MKTLKTCSMIVRCSDGTMEYRNYESYTAMKSDARHPRLHPPAGRPIARGRENGTALGQRGRADAGR